MIIPSHLMINRMSGDFVSILQALIPEAIPSQKRHKKHGSDSLRLREYGYLKCSKREQAWMHVHRQASAPVALRLAEWAVRLCSQTCRYIIKLWIYRLQRL